MLICLSLGGPMIYSSESAAEEMLVGTIEGIEGFYEAKLVEAGFITVKDLANATIAEVEEKTGLEDPYARYLISAAKEILEKAEKRGEMG